MKKTMNLLVVLLVITMLLAGCSKNAQSGQNADSTQSTDSNTDPNADADTNTDVDNADSSASTVTAQAVSITENIKDVDTDSSWDATTAAAITLNGSSVSATGEGVTVSGSTVTITAAGTYVVSGTLNAGQIIIAAGEKDEVRLVLNGVNITADKNAAIYAATADKVVLILSEGKENTLTDAASYTYADETAEEPNAALFAKCDFSINGSGKLMVKGNFKHGIATKDDLVIAGGDITVTAVSTAIRGKDSVTVLGGTFHLTSHEGDGIQTANETETDKGWILIKDGNFTIEAYKDGIQAATAMQIDKGTFDISSGDGMTTAATEDSAKGLKATGNLVINGGTYTVLSKDDSIHSNADITIAGGSFTLDAGDDGIHADNNAAINADINIKECYEGIEATNVVINDGTINVTASDDGINGAGGDSTSTDGGQMQDSFSSSTGSITVNGGILTIAAAGSGSGDGLDANGSLNITGGSITFTTPESARDYEPLDYDGTIRMTGGEVFIEGEKYDKDNIDSVPHMQMGGGGSGFGNRGRRQ